MAYKEAANGSFWLVSCLLQRNPYREVFLGASVAFWGAPMTTLLASVRAQQPGYLRDEFYVP